jgi:hypothetical protein
MGLYLCQSGFKKYYTNSLLLFIHTFKGWVVGMFVANKLGRG